MRTGADLISFQNRAVVRAYREYLDRHDYTKARAVRAANPDLVPLLDAEQRRYNAQEAAYAEAREREGTRGE